MSVCPVARLAEISASVLFAGQRRMPHLYHIAVRTNDDVVGTSNPEIFNGSLVAKIMVNDFLREAPALIA